MASEAPNLTSWRAPRHGSSVSALGSEAVPDLVCRGVQASEAVADFRLACLSRAVDDREIVLRQQNRAFFQVSGAGHEALLVALARDLRAGEDWFFPYYRDRALVLALGVTPLELLLQAVGSKEDPASAGRQMPCHWSDPKCHIVTQSSPTGSQCLPAVGCAEAGAYIRDRDLVGCEFHPGELTYVSLGEGATSEGEFWESLSTACQRKLPVLYVIADNGYAISVRASEQAPAPISQLVAGFPNLMVIQVNGCDYFETRQHGAETIHYIRSGQGPALIHATVTRPYAHSLSDDQKKYRTAAELEAEIERDPITVLERELIQTGVLTAEQARAIRDRVREEVTEAAHQALAAVRPDPLSVGDHVLKPCPVVAMPAEPLDEVGAEPITFGESIRRTLFAEMAADKRIRVFGQDVADADPETLDELPGKGGVFGITFGLQRTYGSDRCYNAPLAEANIIGRAVGQALRGLRPSPEIQFFDYIWPAMTQIKSEAATMRWRSNGAWTCPLVIRIPIGGYLRGGAIWHSQSGESIFAHIPGLRLAYPARARDAAGLLRTAFRCDDPVLFLEHKHLYRQGHSRDPYPPPDWCLPFGKGALLTRGDTVTLVTWGATVHRALQAVRTMDEKTGTVEVIDLRTLIPWDKDLVAESVERTGRVLIVHEDTLTGGFGAEIAAWIADECFEDLDAPILRLAATDTPVAYEPTLEDAILPQTNDIIRDLRHLIEY